MNGHCKQQLLMSWASILWLTASLYGWRPPQILVYNPQIPSLLSSHGKVSWPYFGMTSSKGIPVVASCIAIGTLWWACECECGSVVPLLSVSLVTPILFIWADVRKEVLTLAPASPLSNPYPFYSIIKEKIILPGNGFTLWKCVTQFKPDLPESKLSLWESTYIQRLIYSSKRKLRVLF